jgi:hypothetical protein
MPPNPSNTPPRLGAKGVELRQLPRVSLPSARPTNLCSFGYLFMLLNILREAQEKLSCRGFGGVPPICSILPQDWGAKRVDSGQHRDGTAGCCRGPGYVSPSHPCPLPSRERGSPYAGRAEGRSPMDAGHNPKSEIPRGCRDSSLPRVWGYPPILFLLPPRMGDQRGLKDDRTLRLQR